MHVFDNIVEWAEARNLIDGATPQAQMLKLLEEVGELAADIARGRDVRDSIGDCVVVLTILSAQFSTTPESCARIAYEEIKNRKGKMVDGIFVREE